MGNVRTESRHPDQEEKENEEENYYLDFINLEGLDKDEMYLFPEIDLEDYTIVCRNVEDTKGIKIQGVTVEFEDIREKSKSVGDNEERDPAKTSFGAIFKAPPGKTERETEDIQDISKEDFSMIGDWVYLQGQQGEEEARGYSDEMSKEEDTDDDSESEMQSMNLNESQDPIRTMLDDVKREFDTLSNLGGSSFFCEAYECKWEKILAYFCKRQMCSILNATAKVGHCLQAQHKYEQAKDLYKACLKGRREVPDASPRSVRNAMFRLASCCYHLKKYTQAVEIYTECLDTYQKLEDWDDHGMLEVILNLALYYVKQKRYKEAEGLLIQFRYGHRKIRGEDHARMLDITMHEKTVCLDSQDIHEAVQEMPDKCLERRKKMNYKQKSIILLAFCFWRQKKYGKAAELYLECLDIYSNFDDIKILRTKYRLACCFGKQRKYSKAAALFVECLDGQNAFDEKKILRSKYYLAWCLDKLKKREEAVKLYIECLDEDNNCDEELIQKIKRLLACCLENPKQK